MIPMPTTHADAFLASIRRDQPIDDPDDDDGDDELDYGKPVVIPPLAFVDWTRFNL